MPKIEPVPPVSGADALLALLAVLQDPAAYRQRVQELNDLTAKANAAIALQGTEAEIKAYRDSAELDRAKAADALKQAKAQAQEITAAAVKDRDAALAEATRARTDAWEVRHKIDADLVKAQRDEALRQQAFAEASRRTETAWEEARTAREEAKALEAEWKEKVSKLRAAGVA